MISVLMLTYTYALYKRSKTSPQKVFIGKGGVLYSGYYTTWNMIGSRLDKVKVLKKKSTILNLPL
jgi:hypothetical protein